MTLMRWLLLLLAAMATLKATGASEADLREIY